MTTIVSDLLVDATRRLAGGPTETPRLDAEVLLRHALGATRAQLFAALRDPVADEAADAFRVLVGRRLRGEPVAYLTGVREFMAVPIGVGRAVLVPRPETELLVAWAVGWLARRPGALVVDVGTGSGAIAIGVASHAYADASRSIVAVERSPSALAVARDNIAAACAEGVRLVAGDLLDEIVGPVDLVLANLPYLTPAQIDGNPELAHEPREALDGGADGLNLIRRLIGQLPERLTHDGAVALEIDPSQAATVAELLAEALPGARVTVHLDLAGLDRMVAAEQGGATAERGGGSK